MDDLLSNVLVLCYIFALVSSIWWVWSEIQKQKRRRSFSSRRTNFRRKPGRFFRSKSKARHKIMVMLQGDHQAYERLLSGLQYSNPGKSISWYEEKILYDLERDRR